MRNVAVILVRCLMLVSGYVISTVKPVFNGHSNERTPCDQAGMSSQNAVYSEPATKGHLSFCTEVLLYIVMLILVHSLSKIISGMGRNQACQSSEYSKTCLEGTPQ